MPARAPVIQTCPDTHLGRTRRAHALSEEARIVPMLPLNQQNNTNGHRNSFISIRSHKNAMTSSVTELNEKPLAAAGGMAFDIVLQEPHVFLTGFDHNGRSETDRELIGSAIVRGKLRLNVTKNVKVRGITVKLQGKARTEWPEGLPPLKVEMFEEESLRTMNHTCFNAMHGIWDSPYGDTCSYNLKNPAESPIASALSKFTSSTNSDTLSISSGMSTKDIKRLSLQQVQARSFGKDDSPNVQATHAKGYKVFYPGTYEYPFEFPIDHHQLETINMPFGSVKWELEGCIERAGAFKPNLHGTKRVSVIRVPDQMSLETVEPISISRQWEDQLHYDIVVSGKSFPIGGKIPIAFKLTPLAKVQLHKIKVYITESAEYWTSNRRVTRKDPGRKILLFEKTAGRPVDPQFAASEINFTAGGEPTVEERTQARAAAIRHREREAQRTNCPVEPLPDPSPNMLGDLDLGLESFWGATEMEMNVQLPTCKEMARNSERRIHPDSTWRNATIFHWIKVVLRISRIDPEDPTGQRRRHFEISIDSPFTILSCLATQSNTALPRYTGRDMSFADYNPHSNCGCSDAVTTPPSASPTGSESISFASDIQNPHLSMPQAAHLHNMSSSEDSLGSYTPPTSVGNASLASRLALTDQEAYESPRPIHLLRVPSYAPPAFDADDSPPLPADVMTPPPNYDMIVGTPSVDGLADYFSRLANYDVSTSMHESDTINISLDDDSDSDGDHSPARITSRGGRVNVPHPHTPGGLHRAPSRSMDIQRPAFNLHMSGLRSGAQ
ncbi:hypothetical protein SEUCBS139899_008748 [Sporothrix eucalyptigena]|uniref:Arrestin C-terminal-like domain-containing protein n=1 Tax=Sporothrix eucalyptigena TaxID=1812306 RepID=A0ABP0B8U6_9PEZI